MRMRSRPAGRRSFPRLWRLSALCIMPAVTFALPLPAMAQGVPPWVYSYYRGEYPPPPPPGYSGPVNNMASYEAPRGLTVAEIRRRVAHMGLHLVAKPRRKDNIFLAEAEAAGGSGHRLVFNADSGQLMENTALPPRKKHIRPAGPIPPAPIGH